MIVTLHGGISLYAMQLALSFFGLIFSMLMISTDHDVGTYFPLMTGIVGYWFPSPILLSLKSDSKKIMSNPMVLLFLTQTSLSFLCLLFSCVMLYYDGNPSIYLPVISTVVTIWLPHPSLTQQDENTMNNAVPHSVTCDNDNPYSILNDV